MARISVKQVNEVIPQTNADDAFELACLVALNYPTYSPNSAMQLPIKRLRTMVKVLQKQEAVRYANLLNIIAAPHSEKPDATISRMMGNYQELING